MENNRQPEVTDLWPLGRIPFSIEHSVKEHEGEFQGIRVLYDVVVPTLTVYRAVGNSSGKAVLIMPGGSYKLLAIYHEGYEIAAELAIRGVTAAVLKYRLPNSATSDEPGTVPLADGRRGLSLLREYASVLGFRESEVGVLGFSAGGNLAATLAAWPSDNPAEDPAFQALIYGAGLSERYNDWLQECLYLRQFTPEEKSRHNLAGLVSSSTPPAFLVHSYDDDMVPVEESEIYAQSLRKHNVPVESHLFQRGGHGYGAGRSDDGTDVWISLFADWLWRLEL